VFQIAVVFLIRNLRLFNIVATASLEAFRSVHIN